MINKIIKIFKKIIWVLIVLDIIITVLLSIQLFFGYALDKFGGYFAIPFTIILVIVMVSVVYHFVTDMMYIGVIKD